MSRKFPKMYITSNSGVPNTRAKSLRRNTGREESRRNVNDFPRHELLLPSVILVPTFTYSAGIRWSWREILAGVSGRCGAACKSAGSSRTVANSETAESATRVARSGRRYAIMVASSTGHESLRRTFRRRSSDGQEDRSVPITKRLPCQRNAYE